ncbi:MAG TPA: DNA mismatch endonuclease Vsr [Ignavibacteria bacterium]|nr:DNA mismatch endonuclease Vsr [Ignavibacteria bacterium]
MDIFSKRKRSEIMSHVSGSNTKPELIVRSTLHKMGYRFSLYRNDLPGKPDIILPKYKKIIFIHGCFWHGHKNCPRAKRPSTNSKFWEKKLDENITRDEQILKKLEKLGWGVLIIWTCEIKRIEALQKKLVNFIEEME